MYATLREQRSHTKTFKMGMCYKITLPLLWILESSQYVQKISDPHPAPLSLTVTSSFQCILISHDSKYFE